MLSRFQNQPVDRGRRLLQIPPKCWQILDYVVSHQKITTLIIVPVILSVWILTNSSRAVLKGHIYCILPDGSILFLYVFFHVCCEGLLIYCTILYLLKHKLFFRNTDVYGAMIGRPGFSF